MKINGLSSADLSKLLSEPRPGQQQLQLYVRDDEYGWLPASFLERDGALPDRVKVQVRLPRDWAGTTATSPGDYSLLNRCKKWVAQDDVAVLPSPAAAAAAAAAGSVRDALQLDALHEAALLYLLKQRHSRGLHYTRMGSILLALNPPRQDGDHGDDSAELQRSYAKSFVWQVGSGGSGRDAGATEDPSRFLSLTSTGSAYAAEYEALKLEPHLLEVSARAYRGVLLDGSDQAILLSGLSGSGKTTSYRRLLDHLVSLDALSTDTVLSHGKAHAAMLDRVRSGTSLLQLFGGAATPLSRSSTRFGLVNRLHFELQSTGLLGFAGSRIETYLLETSRVSDGSTGPNFHALYRMLELPGKVKGQLLGLRWAEAEAGDFAYLQRGDEPHRPPAAARGGDAAAGPEQMVQALEGFRCAGLDVRHVLRALASVLCLGNLAFVPSKQGESSSAVHGRTDLDRLASCIGIDAALIEECLTTATSRVGGEVFVTEVSPAVARSASDTLARTIYGFVFDAVARAVNAHTAAALQDGREYGLVTLIDMCGAENLNVNRYEQLCVNYTNEKLQQKYLLDHRESLLAECEKDGVDIFPTARIDNSTIVLAFLEGSGGLFETLKEVNRRRDGGSTLFAMKVKHSNNASKNFALMPNERKNATAEFVIRHFVGPIVYEASNFVERNGESVSTELLQLAAKSSNALITSECCELIRRRDQDTYTPIDKVRASAETLARATKGTQVQHVWCIKPNEIGSPHLVDHKIVLKQLQAVDISTAVKFSEERFSNKLGVDQLCERYRCLLSQKQKRSLKQMESSDRAHYIASNLITRLVEKRGRGDVPFACGTTTVYFRAGALAVLENQRRIARETSALILQDFAGKVLRLTRHRKVLRSIIRIQSLVRTSRNRILFRRQRAATIMLQAVARSLIERRSFHRAKNALTVLAVPFRGFIRALRLRKQAGAATKIAAWCRSRRDAIIYLWFRGSVVALQACHRRRIKKREYLQRLSRLANLAKALTKFIESKRRSEASSCIAAWYRARVARLHFQIFREATIAVQTAVRFSLARQAYKRRRNAAAVMAGACAAFFHQRELKRRVKAATTLSASFRTVLEAKQYRKVRESSIKIQSFTRGHQARVAREQKVRAARVVARACTKFWMTRSQSRERMRDMAASMLASVYRGKKAKAHYTIVRRQAIVIQSLFRMARHRRVIEARKSARRTAVICISTWYRSVKTTRREKAATVIHRAVGAYVLRKLLSRQIDDHWRLTRASTAISSWYLSLHARRSYRFAKIAVIRLQAFWRARKARDEYLIMKGAVLFLETWIQRCVIPQVNWHRDIAAAIIQACVRGFQARSSYVGLRRAALLRQARVALSESTIHSADSSLMTKSNALAGGGVGDDSPTVSSSEGYVNSTGDSSIAPKVTAEQESESEQHSRKNVPDTIAFGRHSRDDLVSDSKERDDSEVIERLTREIEKYKDTIAKLKSEVGQVTEFASLHAQEMEAEFEEKVSLYEDEVLALKQEVARAQQESREVKDSMEAAEKLHQKNLKAIQKGVQKTQASHRDYLDKIMVVLDDTEVARKSETDRIREELNALKRDRDGHIASLKAEIELLRSLGFGGKKSSNCPPGSLTQGARTLAEKLKLVLSPDNILSVVKEAQEHSGSPQRYIDSKLACQARKHVSYLEEMIQIADIEASEQAALAREEKHQLKELEVQLSRAYMEYGRLQRKGFI